MYMPNCVQNLGLVMVRGHRVVRVVYFEDFEIWTAHFERSEGALTGPWCRSGWLEWLTRWSWMDMKLLSPSYPR